MIFDEKKLNQKTYRVYYSIKDLQSLNITKNRITVFFFLKKKKINILIYYLVPLYVNIPPSLFTSKTCGLTQLIAKKEEDFLNNGET